MVKPQSLPIPGQPTWRVSIPQSGFLVVKPIRLARELYHILSFNPSVGILGGQTGQRTLEARPLRKVSIPQSGFLVVKQDAEILAALA